MSDRPGIGHVIVQGVAAAGFDLAPGLRTRSLESWRPLSSGFTTCVLSRVPRVRDRERRVPYGHSTPQEPPSSTAALKRPRSDNSSPSGDETAVPVNTDSEGGFLEVTSRKKKNKNKKRRNATILVASSSPLNATTATPSLMDVVVAPPNSSQAPQAPSKAPKAKQFNNCSAQPTPRQPVPPVIMRDPPQWSRVADLCIEHRIFYTKARPVLHGVSIEASANSRQDDILYVTNLLASVNLDEICRISRLLQCAATPAEKLCILAQYEHILIKLT
ncbi:hypothetical protein ACJJTC_018578 [Scirpophaga incertulas]